MPPGASARDRLRGGEVVFLQDESVEDFYFLCSGTVKLVRESSEGKQTIVDILGPCDWFGEFSFAEGATHSVTAEVVASAKINAVSQRELAAVLRDEPNLLFEMVGRLNISLRESRARNAEFAHLPVRLRALHLLTSLFDRHGKHVNGHWELGVPLARTESPTCSERRQRPPSVPLEDFSARASSSWDGEVSPWSIW